jgi:antitoxin component YwqK of YwqJK toxin-antitoxin module
MKTEFLSETLVKSSLAGRERRREGLVFIILLLILACSDRKAIRVYIAKNSYVVKEVLKNDTNVLDGLYQKIIDDKVVYEATYSKGVLNGISKVFFNDFVYIKEEYQNGKLNGTSSYFDYNQQLAKECIYRQGKLYEVQYNFEIDEKIKDIITFKNGSGLYVNLDLNTKNIQSIFTYKNGEKNGKFILFNKEGNIKLIGALKNDSTPINTWSYSSSFYKIDSAIVFDHSGKQINRIEFKDLSDEKFGINASSLTIENIKKLTQ